MKKYLQGIIAEVMASKTIKFSLQETLASGNRRIIGYVDLITTPVVGSFIAQENTNVNDEKYFKLYEVEKATVVVYESGKVEGFIYVKFRGHQNIH